MHIFFYHLFVLSVVDRSQMVKQNKAADVMTKLSHIPITASKHKPLGIHSICKKATWFQKPLWAEPQAHGYSKSRSLKSSVMKDKERTLCWMMLNTIKNKTKILPLTLYYLAQLCFLITPISFSLFNIILINFHLQGLWKIVTNTLLLNCCFLCFRSVKKLT